jgi:hypothetical protein
MYPRETKNEVITERNMVKINTPIAKSSITSASVLLKKIKIRHQRKE